MSGAGGGGIPATNGNSHWYNSCGTSFRRVNPITATTGDNDPFSGASVVTYVGSVNTSCQTATIEYFMGTTLPPSRGLAFTVENWRGVQPTIDDGVGVDQGGFASNPNTVTTPNLTTSVANEMLSAAASSGDGDVSQVTSIASPFTTTIPWTCLFHFECLVTSQDQVTTATTYSATASDPQASGNENTLALSLIGLRPALPTGSCNISSIGEKQRRQP